MKTKNSYFALLLIVLALPLKTESFGQVIIHEETGERIPDTLHERVNLAAGAGFNELINIGIRYQLNQRQLGFSIGYFSYNNENAYSFSFKFMRHFAGYSGFTERIPWYITGGLHYTHAETSHIIDRYIFTTLRVGRDFNLSQRIGIELDGGISARLYHDETIRTPGGGGFGLGIFLPVYTSFSASIFYRIRR